ncbi:MAG TPA: hypothetical protein VGC18_11765 [Lacisediminihabitans sp.]|uniref:hypothetical protein n=1 Tax=Lacisediminihabitans sp. TaxID=2787631 RepID=UPI002ED956DC
MRTVSGAFAALAALLLLLCGCAPSGPRPSSTPGPSPTPIFATEADALAAATDAYAAYVRVSDQILMDGGANPDRIREVATGDALQTALDGYATFRDKQYRAIGGSKISHTRLQRYFQNEKDGAGIVSTYSCLDVSQVDVLDVNGVSVVSASRPNIQAFELSFDWTPRLQRLLLASRTAWSGDGLCTD